MNYIKQNHLQILTLVLVAFFVFGGAASTKIFGVAADVTTVSNPWIFANTASGITFSGDATFSGRDGGIVVTTSNSATSSIEAGCFTSYATSTATAVRLVFGSGVYATTSTSGTNTIGLMGWQYGTCPN